MEYRSEIFQNKNKALVFAENGPAMVVGVIINANGKIVSQILNPAQHSPLDLEERVDRHHVIKVAGMEYIAVDLDKPHTVKDYIQMANKDACDTNLMYHLKINLYRNHDKSPGIN